MAIRALFGGRFRHHRPARLVCRDRRGKLFNPGDRKLGVQPKSACRSSCLSLNPVRVDHQRQRSAGSSVISFDCRLSRGRRCGRPRAWCTMHNVADYSADAEVICIAPSALGPELSFRGFATACRLGVLVTKCWEIAWTLISLWNSDCCRLRLLISKKRVEAGDLELPNLF